MLEKSELFYLLLLPCTTVQFWTKRRDKEGMDFFLDHKQSSETK